MYNGYYPMVSTQIIHVNGENGAMTLNLAPNSSVLALDENAPVVWLCRSDGAGYKTCTPYQISEIKPKETPTIDDIIGRIQRLEERLNESDTKRTKSATGEADTES